MLAGLTALWVFMKINKHSFYHHFFRVIEEVELRNSHDLVAADLMVLTQSQLAPASLRDRFLPLPIALFGLLFLLVMPLWAIPVPREVAPLRLTDRRAYLLPPVRAP